MIPREPGDPAPDFELRDQHGRPVVLSEHRGTAVLLVFYPFVFSRVCSGELAALEEAHDDVVSRGATLLAVSCDPVYALRAYAEPRGVPFPLLSDFWPHGAVASAYGVLDERSGAPTRSTFLVDAGGILRWSLHNPSGQPRDLAATLAAVSRVAEKTRTME